MTADPRGYTDADLAEVMDAPEMTDEQLAASRPFAEVFPGIAATIASRGGKAPGKVPVSLKLDPEVVRHYKAGGRGWQARMGAALRKAAGL